MEKRNAEIVRRYQAGENLAGENLASIGARIHARAGAADRQAIPRDHAWE
jgi:hypothetical protein